jgi:phosphate transport system protein
MSEKTLKEKLQQLEEELLALGGLVEGMLLQSVDLLKRCDLDGLERVGDDERQIREKRLAIEMGCLQLIATRLPRDGDLRTAVATVEIATELERMGEHAKQVARANSLTTEHHLRRPLIGIHRLATEVQALLSRVMTAFAQRDVVLARTVFVDAQRADDRYKEVHQELLAVMNRRARVANQAIYLARAAYNLRRAAERATAICEWVVFIVVGTMEQAPPGQSQYTTEEHAWQQQTIAD